MFFLIITTFVVVVSASNDGNVDEASLRSLSHDEMRMAKDAGYSYVDRLAQLEEDMYAQGLHVKEDSPMSMMAKFKRPTQEVIDLSRRNLRFVETVRFLKNDLGLKEEELERNMREEDFDCLSDPVCPKSKKYRTIDGSCNHDKKLKNLGKSVSGYRRFLKPAYDDGVSSPRRHSVTGDELPSPRLISMTAFSDRDIPLKQVTSLLMQFGQFINHDLESTSQFTFRDGVGFSCCADKNQQLDPSVLECLIHCLPISIPIGDRQLQNDKTGCMNFVRSSTGPNRINCDLPFVSYAEQFNQNTHWLDASTVYGSNNETMSLLRDRSTGVLISDSEGRRLLPSLKLCGSKESGCVRLRAGDLRVDEQPQLTVIHTIWMREHNRIANILAELNPTWSGETVFQEARRIVIAELQHITYKEFLPTLLGYSGMQRYNLLWPLPGKKTFRVVENEDQEWTTVYRESQPDFQYKKITSTSGPISNEFAAAAFRMGHSLVQGNVQLIDVNGNVATYNLKDFFNSQDLFSKSDFLDNTIRGLTSQSSQTIDNQIDDSLWLHLFETSKPAGYGEPANPSNILDIVSLNIQRGRDHGLPSYNSYREKCGLPKLEDPISSLPTKKPRRCDPKDPISPYFDPWVVDAWSKIYKSVDDIDLYVGGVAEISPLGDGLIGPTFMCIIADNFLNLKFEDRYFYEAGEGSNPNPFTPEQLMEIKKSSMSRILCDNNDGTVSTVQPNAFAVPSETNAIADCKDDKKIPSLNLNRWKVCRHNKNCAAKTR